MRAAKIKHLRIYMGNLSMGADISVKISGEAGQGIQTVGSLISLVCRNAGLHMMAINDFESRIRGGDSFFQIRISDRPIGAPSHRVNLLVALNKKTYDVYRSELLPEGIVLLDAEEAVEDENLLPVAFAGLSQKTGGKITSNTIAAGACLSLLGAPVELLENVLADLFEKKGTEVINNNISAARLGYEAVENRSFKWTFQWKEASPAGALISGAKAIALGALAGDCRFASFYPMSPATGILSHLTEYTDRFPLVVEQAEDEIAAINMIIGASFAGVRSITGTSGGGFCLMTEGLGLAAITETPLVIVNAQRPGPATGLPTRTAQADLLFIIRSSQDEFPRFVFAPGTPDEAFDATARAFYLSEKYQVPVIILTDMMLNDSMYISEKPFSAPQYMDDFVVTDDRIEDPSVYKRYAITTSGVSPRALPCMGNALVLASGNEHSEDGHISEKVEDRSKMVDKRHAKVPHMIKEMHPPEAYHGESDILLVGWGSTKGAVKEAVDILRNDNLDAGCLHFVDLWPFPVDSVVDALSKGKNVIIVEQNRTAQLGSLIREQTGLSYSDTVLKYDGRPFYPYEIANAVKQITG